MVKIYPVVACDMSADEEGCRLEPVPVRRAEIVSAAEAATLILPICLTAAPARRGHIASAIAKCAAGHAVHRDDCDSTGGDADLTKIFQDIGEEA